MESLIGLSLIGGSLTLIVVVCGKFLRTESYFFATVINYKSLGLGYPVINAFFFGITQFFVSIRTKEGILRWMIEYTNSFSVT